MEQFGEEAEKKSGTLRDGKWRTMVCHEGGGREKMEGLLDLGMRADG